MFPVYDAALFGFLFVFYNNETDSAKLNNFSRCVPEGCIKTRSDDARSHARLLFFISMNAKHKYAFCLVKQNYFFNPQKS